MLPLPTTTGVFFILTITIIQTLIKHCSSSAFFTTTTTTIITTAHPKHHPQQTSHLHARKKNHRNRISTPQNPLAFEHDLQTKRGFTHIIGSDESGVGCLAGPVLTASVCILTNDYTKVIPIPNVADSKTLTHEQRCEIYNQVVNAPDLYAFQIAQRSNVDIDTHNILRSTMNCFAESIETLVLQHNFPINTTYSIVDGQKSPKLNKTNVSSRPLVKGDSMVYTISLASILAKVTRDEVMRGKDVHGLYPEYGFDVHFGYSTKEHVEAIHRYGACPVHRMSCKPLKGR